MMDPDLISSNLGMEPDQKSKAGSPIVKKHGFASERNAKLSVWIKDMHEEKRLRSDKYPISTQLYDVLSGLWRFRDFFMQVNETGGVVQLNIGWYNDTFNSTGEIDAVALKMAGSLGISLLLDIFGPQEK